MRRYYYYPQVREAEVMQREVKLVAQGHILSARVGIQN